MEIPVHLMQISDEVSGEWTNCQRTEMRMTEQQSKGNAQPWMELMKDTAEIAE